MQHSFLLLWFLIVVAAYPVPLRHSQLCSHKSVQVLERNEKTRSINVQFECHDCLDDDSSKGNALILTLEAPHCPTLDHPDCSALVVGQDTVSFDSSRDIYLDYNGVVPPGPISIAQHSLATVLGRDELNREHSIEVYVILGLDLEGAPSQSPTSSSAHFNIESVDGRKVAQQSLKVNWKRGTDGQFEPSYVRYVDPSGSVEMDDLSCLVDTPDDKSMAHYDDHAEQQSIDAELETLRLLEQEASELQKEIALRKQTLSSRMVEYRSQKTLQELIDQCDDVLCTAKQIATRLYDQINLATSNPNPSITIQQVESNTSNQGAQNDTALSGRTFMSDNGGGNDYFTKALSYIASLLGLTWLVLFLRRKCMSMRKRVERAADREERRNARAYRRAARRAEMRKRLSALVPSFAFLRNKQQARMTDYDEKRALILQDALLEQDFNLLADGDVMEAEIRQLRHAHDIVSNIMRGNNDKKGAGLMLARDLPPSQVPLPQIRSRSSTGTLPSYNSDGLPDYSSLPDPRSDNTTADGSASYSAFIEHDMQYIPAAPLSEASDQTRSTPVSSLPAISRRASQETLQTRTSRVGSLGSMR